MLKLKGTLYCDRRSTLHTKDAQYVVWVDFGFVWNMYIIVDMVLVEVLNEIGMDSDWQDKWHWDELELLI